MGIHRFRGQVGSAKIGGTDLKSPHPSPRRCALAAPPSPKGDGQKRKETPGLDRTRTGGNRKKNIFIIDENPPGVKALYEPDGKLKEIATPVCGLVRNDSSMEIGDTAFWANLRDVMEGDVCGECLDLSTGKRLLEIITPYGRCWFSEERLCRTREEAAKKIEENYFSIPQSALRADIPGKEPVCEYL